MAFGVLNKDSIYEICDCAAEFLAKHYVTHRPIDIKKLALAAGVVTINRQLPPGIEACIEPERGFWLISLTTAANSPVHSRSRRRFTIGHELGHFALPTHQGRPFMCRTTDIGLLLDSQRLQEEEANYFSSEVLMPHFMFKKDMDECGLEFHEAVRVLASEKYYNTSLRATFIRYVTLVDIPIIWVVYRLDGERRWWCTSETWDCEPLLADLVPPKRLPPECCAWEITTEIDELKDHEKAKGEIEASQWFPPLGSNMIFDEIAGYIGREELSVFLVPHNVG